jgi:uncharacterized RDD family membrane protein YckC
MTLLQPPPTYVVAPGTRFEGPVLAGIGKRFAAFVIDLVVTYLVLLVCFLLPTLIVGDNRQLANTAALIAVVLVLAYAAGIIVCLGLVGRTPGKAAMGIKLVDATTLESIGFGRSLLRWVVLIPLAIFWPWDVLILLSVLVFDPTKRGQGWHDKAARTLQIDTRRGIDTTLTVGPFPQPVNVVRGLVEPIAVPAPGFAAPGYAAPEYAAPGHPAPEQVDEVDEVPPPENLKPQPPVPLQPPAPPLAPPAN